MGVIGIILAVSALLFCVYLYFELQKKLSSEDVGSKLALASEELAKNYGKQFREIESEWADQYQKFMRLAGRFDKTRALEQPAKPTNRNELTEFKSRSDILRRSKGGLSHVQNV